MSSQIKSKSVYKKDEKIDISKFAGVNDEFGLISQFLSKSLPLVIKLPFQGTNLKIMKGDRYFVFVSREGRLAVIDSKEQVILRDEVVSKGDIWALALSKDEEYIFFAGIEPIIKKYSFETLKFIESFEGHAGDVNSVLISQDDAYMYSCGDDGTVRVWSVRGSKSYQKVLFTHSDIVYALDLSENNVYIASGSGDESVIIYELGWEGDAETGSILKKLDLKRTIWAVKISPSNRFLITGDSEGNVIVWSFLNWDQVKKFKEGNRIRSIDIAKDESYLVTAGQDQKVVIWHLDKNRDPIVLKNHSDMVKSAILTHDQEFIVSLADDTLVIRWKIPFFEDKVILNSASSVYEVWGVNTQTIGITSTELIVWDLQGHQVKSIIISNYSNYYKSEDNFLYLFYVTGQNSEKIKYLIKEINLATTEYGKETFIETSQIKSICMSSNRKFLCIGRMNKVTTFLVEQNMKVYNSQNYHEGDVKTMALTPDNTFLFTAGEHGDVKMIDTDKMKDSALRNVLSEINLFGSEDNVKFVCTKDSKKLIMYSYEKMIIWSISQRTVLKQINFPERVESLVLSQIYRFFFTKTADFIEVWDFKDFNYITKISFAGLKSFAFVNSEMQISLCYDDRCECIESPVFSKNLKIVGEDVTSHLNSFLKYTDEIISGKSDAYQDLYKSWLIIPFMINIQHIYAYYNYSEYLKLAYINGMPYGDSQTSLGDAPFVQSGNKHTALSISVNQNYPECAKIILKALRKRWDKDPLSLVFVSDSITALNNMGLDGLHTLYNFALRGTFLKNLPTFGSNTNLPIIFQSNSIEIDPVAVLGKTPDASDGNAIVFEQTYFSVNMNLGSSDGLKFLESIMDCKNDRIFETLFIQIILQEKWKKARFVMFGQAFCYVFFMVSLAYFLILELKNSTFLLIPSGMNAVLLLNEFYQIYSGGVKYFADVWNYIDLMRSSLFFLYAILIWIGYFETNPDFLALVILVTWIRGVTYFRIFGPTRYLINLLFEVFSDIRAFLIIYFYTIVAFSFVFYSINTDNTIDYYGVLVDTYSTSLGNPSGSLTSRIQWLFYVLITLFNFIIMLNLLISILSDTYNRVNENQTIADALELASMIYEVEMMMFWRRKMNEKQYLHICRSEISEEIGLERIVVNKFKNMNEKYNLYEKIIHENIVKLEGLNENMKGKNNEFRNIVGEIKKRYKLN